MDSAIAISGDPGSKNFALSVVEGAVIDGKLKIKIHGTAMLIEEALLYDLTKDVTAKLRNFRRVLKNLAYDYGYPDAVYFERFQTRGIKGKTIECISMMNAIPALVFGKAEPKFITAATWKNRANARFDLKNSYKDYNLHRVITNKAEHELDACLIGIYSLHKHFGLPDFELLHEDNFPKFIEAFLASPNLDLRIEKV